MVIVLWKLAVYW